MKKPDKKELPVIAFESPLEWEQWLATNHTDENGIWLRLFKKNTAVPSVTYAQALDEALCYGWIDGQKKSYDELSYLQKFTPRRKKSIWSKKNIEHIARLHKQGKMKPSGIKEAELAKADGRWEQAYDSPSNMKIPDDFLQRLSKNKKAKTFFETLNKANTYAIAWRLQTAKKPETREKRMQQILDMLSQGKKFHG
jgi:uncharacterized protein YdeI (YjbR/CyaY-like superfamily)